MKEQLSVKEQMVDDVRVGRCKLLICMYLKENLNSISVISICVMQIKDINSNPMKTNQFLQQDCDVINVV